MIAASRLGGDDMRRQVLSHITEYTNRAAEIQRTLRAHSVPSVAASTAAAAAEPPAELGAFEVDTAALSQMMDMGFTSEKAYDALRYDLRNPLCHERSCH